MWKLVNGKLREWMQIPKMTRGKEEDSVEESSSEDDDDGPEGILEMKTPALGRAIER